MSTPGTTAPVGSSTVPRIVESADCPSTETDKMERRTRARPTAVSLAGGYSSVLLEPELQANLKDRDLFVSFIGPRLSWLRKKRLISNIQSTFMPLLGPCQAARKGAYIFLFWARAGF